MFKDFCFLLVFVRGYSYKYLIIKLYGVERVSFWNLYIGRRKQYIYLKVENVRECQRILEMYRCGFEKEKY